MSAPTPSTPSRSPSTGTLMWVAPLAVAAQVVFFAIASGRDEVLVPSAMAWGALGWVVALALRMPFIAAARRLIGDDRRTSTVTVALSGPAEESVRLIMVLVLISTVPGAYSLGLGWGLIEVVYGIVNAFALMSISRRQDEEARQAMELMQSMGVRTDTPPAWGILERLSATSLHIGFALLLSWNGWLVLALMPIHSATNLGVLELNKRNAALAQLAIAVVGVGALVLGIALTGF